MKAPNGFRTLSGPGGTSWRVEFTDTGVKTLVGFWEWKNPPGAYVSDHGYSMTLYNSTSGAVVTPGGNVYLFTY